MFDHLVAGYVEQAMDYIDDYIAGNISENKVMGKLEDAVDMLSGLYDFMPGIFTKAVRDGIDQVLNRLVEEDIYTPGGSDTISSMIDGGLDAIDHHFEADITPEVTTVATAEATPVIKLDDTDSDGDKLDLEKLDLGGATTTPVKGPPDLPMPKDFVDHGGDVWYADDNGGYMSAAEKMELEAEQSQSGGCDGGGCSSVVKMASIGYGGGCGGGQNVITFHSSCSSSSMDFGSCYQNFSDDMAFVDVI